MCIQNHITSIFSLFGNFLLQRVIRSTASSQLLVLVMCTCQNLSIFASVVWKRTADPCSHLCFQTWQVSQCSLWAPAQCLFAGSVYSPRPAAFSPLFVSTRALGFLLPSGNQCEITAPAPMRKEPQDKVTDKTILEYTNLCVAAPHVVLVFL